MPTENTNDTTSLARGKTLKLKITPLVSMNVVSLERAVAAMQKIAFSDIMEYRIQQDQKLSRPEAASSWVSRGTPRKIDKHIEIIKECSAETQADFGMVEE
jgi:hypothetical protein